MRQELQVPDANFLHDQVGGQLDDDFLRLQEVHTEDRSHPGIVQDDLFVVL
jgi:hypothetical protein